MLDTIPEQLKSSLDAANNRPEVAPATPAWKVARDAAVAESKLIESYERDHRCTSAEATLAVRSRAAAVTTLPKAADALAKREARAAHELELVEAERAAMADLVRQWEGLKSRRTTIIAAIGEANDLAATCTSHAQNAPALIIEGAVQEHWPLLRTLGDFSLMLAAERAAVEFTKFATAKEAELEALEVEMKSFARKNGLPADSMP